MKLVEMRDDKTRKLENVIKWGSRKRENSKMREWKNQKKTKWNNESMRMYINKTIRKWEKSRKKMIE